MARFYGTLQGARGEATRLGHASSGLHTTTSSWNGSVRTVVYADNDTDKVRIRAEQHGSSRNPTGELFDGTFEELGELIGWWRKRDQINAVLALMSDGQLAKLTRKEPVFTLSEIRRKAEVVGRAIPSDAAAVAAFANGFQGGE